MNEEQAKKLRDVEIEVAQMKISLDGVETSVLKNLEEVSVVKDSVSSIRENFMAKTIIYICTIVGLMLGIVEYAKSAEYGLIFEQGREDYEYEKQPFDYTAATFAVCKSVFGTSVSACAEATKELYEKDKNEYYSIRIEYFWGNR